MEQDERAVADLPEGEKEQGGEVPVPGGVASAEGSLAREAASSSELEAVSRVSNAAGHGAAGSESDEEGNEEALAEELEGAAPVGHAGQWNSSGSAQNEDHEVPEENPAKTHFELRGFRPARRLIAHAMPPSSYRRVPLRCRKRSNPTRLIVVGATASGGAIVHDPGTSEAAGRPSPSASFGSVSATSRPAGVSATVNAGAGHGEAMGSTAIRWELDAAVDKGDRKSGTDAKDAAAAEAEASSSCRLPSRSRKQRRPDHFISDTEEAVSAARAKAPRSNTALDRFLTPQVRTSPPGQRPEWLRNVTAGGVGAGAQGQRGNDAFRTGSGGGPEGPDGSARILAIVAILGASLALSVVSCVLFYIAGQQTASGWCDAHRK